MDNREHFSGIDDPIDLQIGGVEVFALLDCLFIVIALCQPLEVCLIETVDFVFHIFAQTVHFAFCEPFCMEVAPALVFGEIFVFLTILSFSSP